MVRVRRSRLAFEGKFNYKSRQYSGKWRYRLLVEKRSFGFVQSSSFAAYLFLIFDFLVNVHPVTSLGKLKHNYDLLSGAFSNKYCLVRLTRDGLVPLRVITPFLSVFGKLFGFCLLNRSFSTLMGGHVTRIGLLSSLFLFGVFFPPSCGIVRSLFFPILSNRGSLELVLLSFVKTLALLPFSFLFRNSFRWFVFFSWFFYACNLQQK